MSRAVLRELGLDLPIFPTTSVGSFPKPDGLKQARAAYASGKIDAGQLAEHERQATQYWLDVQRQAGIDVAVDGEMYRGDMVAFFAEHIREFEIGGLVRSYGNRFYRKPIIVAPVKVDHPMTVEWWQWAQARCDQPVKGMLTGPYTIMDWSFNEHYPSRHATTMALADCIRAEVQALIAAGCRIVQIDEPAVSVRPDEMDTAIEALHKVVHGQKAYFITHICYGNFDRVYPKMLELPVHNLDLELANRDMDLLEHFKAHPFTKDISVGVEDVHHHQCDEVEVLVDRIRRAAEVLPTEAMWLDPDCGLKTRTVAEGVTFIRRLTRAAGIARQGLR